MKPLKYSLLVLAAILPILLLSGCGGSSDGSDEDGLIAVFRVDETSWTYALITINSEDETLLDFLREEEAVAYITANQPEEEEEDNTPAPSPDPVPDGGGGAGGGSL